MKSAAIHLQITYGFSIIDVEKLPGVNPIMYKLRFSNEVPEMTLQSLQSADGNISWEFIPPGNTALADSLGKLIEEYFQDLGDDDNKE